MDIIKITLSQIQLLKQEWYDESEYTLYYPEDDIILQYRRDEQDISYRFYAICHVPILKIVLFLSGYRVAWLDRCNTMETLIDKCDAEGKIESTIREIMNLPDDYIVTDSKAMFKKKREEYLQNNDVLNDEQWLTFDVDSVEPINGKYFVNGYPDDNDVNKKEKIEAIPWNSPSNYVCWLMSYFQYINRPSGAWDHKKVNKDTCIAVLI